MPQYFLLILAANAFFGALLYYFGNSMGISKRTSLIITGVSFVISFFFPIALSYLKLYQILVIILTVITLTAYLLQKDFHSQEQEYDEQINKEPDFVELKTAEDYLKAEEDKYANEAATVLDEAPTCDEAIEQPASEIHIDTRLDIEPEQEPEPEAQPEPEPELELEADTEAEPETELVSEPEPALVPEPEIEPEQNSITLRNADIQVYGETSLVTKDNFNEVAIIPLLEQAEKAATEEEPVRDIFEYIDKAFSCRANEDYELALEALSEAVSKTDDANMNFLITMETSSIHKEKGDYQQASSIIAAYMIQFGDTLNSESQMDLLLNLKYIEILQELLASNGTPDMPLKLIPNLLLKKAEDRLEEWKWKMLI